METVWYLPQLSWDVEPSVLVVIRELHLIQTLEPLLSLNVPTGHATQLPVFRSKYRPAAQYSELAACK